MLPLSFTTENVMKIHQGMGSDEILAMFGTPKNVSQTVCGANVGHPWNCTTWEYGEFPNSESFTFRAIDGGSSVLNNFDIHRSVETLRSPFTTEKVMKIRQGMGSNEILAMFGPPRNVRQDVCGTKTDQPWSCRTWEYGEAPRDASFTFSEDGGSLLLNNFTVHKN
jgi:hypothetical protein